METTPAPTASDIISRVRSFITDYVSLPDESYADALALYVMHTHTFPPMQRDPETGTLTRGTGGPRTTPYIYITSQGPGSGKTRVMEVLNEICRASQLFSGMTGPTLFHMVESIQPTLFLDEVDAIYSGAKNEELRGVLNSGYKHNGKVPRVDPKSELGFREYSTFCPKVLAGIDNGQVPNTVLDRSITIRLVKAAPGKVAPFYSEDVEDLAADLIEEIQTWYAANRDSLEDRTKRPEPIEGLSDRQNDIVRPLLTIAATVPGWAKRARMSMVAVFSDAGTPLTPQADALNTVREYMVAHDLDRISSAKVAEIVGQNAKQVGAWLAAFDVTPATLRGFDSRPAARTDGQSDKVKGYLRTGQMEAAWDRFLPALPTNL